MNTTTILCGDCLALMRDMEADSVDLVMGSPPYLDCRTYGIGAQRGFEEWVAWMLEVTTEAARICRGPVFWVAAGVTRKRNYQPGPEALMVDWFRRGGDCQLYRPAVFHRVGIFGSGGDDYLRADWEYVLCFKRPGKLAWSENTAAGHSPRWAPGGEMSHRLTDGQRRNQWGGTDGDADAFHGNRQQNGKRDKKFRPSHRQPGKSNANDEMEVQKHAPPAIANPGNLLTGIDYPRQAQELLDRYERGDVRSGVVGGGAMGHPLAHENEAPYPEWLCEVFVASFCPPDGTILDPFSGSGTTLAVAREWGRNGIGIDIRESQCEIARARLAQQLLPMGE